MLCIQTTQLYWFKHIWPVYWNLWPFLNNTLVFYNSRGDRQSKKLHPFSFHRYNSPSDEWLCFALWPCSSPVVQGCTVAVQWLDKQRDALTCWLVPSLGVRWSVLWLWERVWTFKWYQTPPVICHIENLALLKQRGAEAILEQTAEPRSGRGERISASVWKLVRRLLLATSSHFTLLYLLWIMNERQLQKNVWSTAQLHSQHGVQRLSMRRKPKKLFSPSVGNTGSLWVSKITYFQFFSLNAVSFLSL